LYLVDLFAIEKDYPKFKSCSIESKTRFKDSENLKIKKILLDYQEVVSSTENYKILILKIQRTESFNQFIKGVKRLLMYKIQVNHKIETRENNRTVLLRLIFLSSA